MNKERKTSVMFALIHFFLIEIWLPAGQDERWHSQWSHERMMSAEYRDSRLHHLSPPMMFYYLLIVNASMKKSLLSDKDILCFLSVISFFFFSFLLGTPCVTEGAEKGFNI
jgi:hypothetical protein